MIANAPTPVINTGVDYTLTPTRVGWRLTAWESAEVTEERLRPFLWKFEVELQTWDEAQTTLQVILEGDST